MAVEKMMLVNIVGPVNQFDIVSKNCIVGKNFQPENANNLVFEEGYFGIFSEDNPYATTLRKIGEFASRAKINLKYSDFLSHSEKTDEIEKKIDEITNKFEIITEKIKQLEKNITEDEQILIQLDHIKNISVILDDLFSFEFVRFRFGRLPRENYEKLKYDENDEMYFIPTFIEKEYVWGMYYTPRVFKTKVDAFFASISFERIRISDRAHGTPASAYTDIMHDIDSNKIELKKIKSEYLQFVAEASSEILPMFSEILYLHDTFSLRKYATKTKNNFYLIGWVPEHEAKEFMERFQDIDAVSCVSETPDEVDIPPPTKLKNNFLFKPFESFVKLYGLPSYFEFDPSPVVAITYTLLFGIMFGDVGQGALLLLAGLFMWFVKKNIFGRIVISVSISSILFGFVYGSVFGYEDIIHGLIRPLERTNDIMLWAVMLGTLFISLGMFLNVWNGIKQKNLEKAVFSHNGLIGIIFYWALLAVAISSIIFGKDIMNIAYVILLLVLPLILMFLKEPLAHILSKREKFTFHGSKMDFVIENFFELVDVVLSFVTNTISFVRVGAFAISHAGMMMVVFIFARGAGESDNLIVVIIGNLFVMALEGMIVGIQVLRLQFYEIFSRFFSGEGKEYEPFSINNENSKNLN